MPSIIPMKGQSTEQAGTTYGNFVDASGYQEVFVTLTVGTASGTDPTLDVQLQHSPDGVNWKNLFEDFQQGVFPRMEASGSETIRISKFAKYIRPYWTIGGTTPVFSFDLSATMRS